MPQPFEFPGHYWDEEKQKFFKIENTGTTPAGAAWSRERVSHQRQRARREEIGRARTKSRQRASKRTKYSEDDETEPKEEYEALPTRAVTRLAARLPFHGRETGCVGTPAAPSVSTGYVFEPSLRGLAASWYTQFLHGMGETPILSEEAALSLDPRASTTGPFTIALGVPKRLSTTDIDCMYIQPDPGPPGFGIVYTNYRGLKGYSIKGQYIMTEDEVVCRDWPARPPHDKYRAWERTRPELGSSLRPSTISYHESSRNLIVTSRSARLDEPLIQVFSPHTPEPDCPANMGVSWQMGLTQQRGNGYMLIDGHTVGANSINACVPSPNGFDALCVVGTDVGIAVVDLNVGQSQAAFGRGGDKTTLKLRPPQPPPPPPSDRDFGGKYHHKKQERSHHDRGGFVASVDFVHNHPSLVVAGGRFATPWLVDLRESSTSREGTTWRAFQPFGIGDTSDMLDFDDWDNIESMTDPYNMSEDSGRGGGRGRGRGKGRGKANVKAKAPEVWNAAHVRSVNENHVVVAGLRNTMVLYDLRYVSAPPSKRATGGSWTISGPSSNSRSVLGASIGAEPLLRFSNYFNEARMTGLGFAVEKQLGIVAAAEEHGPSAAIKGGIGLFSLATGERLEAPHLKDSLCYSAEALERAYPSLKMKSGWPTITCTTTTTKTEPAPTLKGPAALPQVPALSFAELPGESGPSLFSGFGVHVKKFSARKILEDVIDDDEEDRPKVVSFDQFGSTL